jgi:hypothetical protein
MISPTDPARAVCDTAARLPTCQPMIASRMPLGVRPIGSESVAIRQRKPAFAATRDRSDGCSTKSAAGKSRRAQREATEGSRCTWSTDDETSNPFDSTEQSHPLRSNSRRQSAVAVTRAQQRGAVTVLLAAPVTTLDFRGDTRRYGMARRVILRASPEQSAPDQDSPCALSR